MPRLSITRMLGIAAALAALAAPARAQQPVDDVLIPETQDAQEVGFNLDDSNFYMWIFNRSDMAGAITAEYFAPRLSLRVEEVDRACGGLTEVQRARLRLAARGDAKRFLDLVAEKKRLFDRLKHDRSKINEIYQEIAPLQAIVNAGFFGKGSLFDKSIATTLTSEQAARFHAAREERRRWAYRARLRMIVGMMEPALGLTADQSRRLTEILAAEIRPPKVSPQGMEYYYVLNRARRIPRPRLREIFDDAQWKFFTRQLEMARGYDQFLESNGMVDPAEDAQDPLLGPDRVFAK